MNEEADGWSHPDEATLGRLAEDGLEAVGPEVRAHVEGCRSCREEVAALRRLLRAAEALPAGIAPSRDLWPEVEARVRGEAGCWEPPEDPDGPGLREATPWLAAAAAVLIAVTAGATFWLAGAPSGPEVAGGERAPALGGPSGPTAVPAMVRGVRSGYAPLIDRLDELVERRRDRLPPETRRVLERNLEIIDAAIAEAEAALAESPSSPGLIRALDRSYDRKIELLRRSARLTARL